MEKKSYPDLCDMIAQVRVLLDVNILEFSVLRELALYLSVSDDKEMLATMVSQLNNSFKDKLEQFANSMTFTNYSVLTNYSIFFMILLINLKSKKSFVINVFEKESKLVKTLLQVILTSKEYHNRISKILCNLFLDDYKDLYFGINPDEELEELFIINNEKFSKVNNEGIDVYPKSIYKSILEKILTLDLSYEAFFSSKTINDSDKPAIKLLFSQSMIRVVFSKEKNIYIEYEENYEFKFLNHVITKCLTDTKDFYGDIPSCLFRKEELYDDIIKFLFFIFGNSLLLKAFVIPLKNVIPTFESMEEIPIDDFLQFYEKLITSISCYMPFVLKVVLKTLYIKVNEIFTIDKDNFAPLYTVLIFNFFISPKIQDMYDIGPGKFSSVRSVNRILRNICYNTMFDTHDKLSFFNPIIPACNKEIRDIMDMMISSFDEDSEEAQKLLKESISDKYLLYPKFLFYIDCSYLANIFQSGFSESFNFQECIKKTSASIK